MKILKELKDVVLCSGTIRGMRVTEEAMIDLVKQLQAKSIQSCTGILGELGQPIELTPERCTTISIENVSHQLINIRFEDGKILADIWIIDTEAGKTLIKFMEEEEIRFGFRGMVEMSEADYCGEKLIRKVVPITYDAILKSEFFS